MRLRAAKQAGLTGVPVTIATCVIDAYAQVVENQKRQRLAPLDLARFIRSRSDIGESNAKVANKLGMDLTTVAHHLALLALPPVLDDALKSGRCTSARMLYELNKLHLTHPDRVIALVSGESEITRSAIAGLRIDEDVDATPVTNASLVTRRKSALPLVDRANSLCDRLDAAVRRLTKSAHPVSSDELTVFRQRLIELAQRLGS